VLYVGVGKKDGLRPGDLVGAIAGETGIDGRQLGAIQIGPDHARIEVPEALASRIIAAIGATTIRGRTVEIRRERSRT
jgi:ATP-dependent RNA helicase DeaD